MTEYDYNKNIWGRGMASLSFNSPAYFRLKNALKFLNKKSGNVLELGCGAGQFIRAIKNKRPDINCYGCDISKTAIEEANKIGGGIKYDVSEENNLPYEDNFFDSVLIFDVLEHVENPDIILKEVNRILKPGGMFFAYVPSEGDFLSLWFWLRKLGLGKDLTRKYAGHIQYFSRKSLRKLFLANNFKINKKIYSEHFLGQLAGVVAFWSMNKYNKIQINNEEFFNNKNKLTGLRKLGNVLINLESEILKYLPSPNISFICQKVQK